MCDTDFFGRVGELESLQDAYDSRTAEMAIIYGRRRIGKTALIQKFCEGKPAFFLHGENMERSVSIGSFFSGRGNILWESAIALSRMDFGAQGTCDSAVTESQGDCH